MTMMAMQVAAKTLNVAVSRKSRSQNARAETHEMAKTAATRSVFIRGV